MEKLVYYLTCKGCGKSYDKYELLMTVKEVNHLCGRVDDFSKRKDVAVEGTAYKDLFIVCPYCGQIGFVARVDDIKGVGLLEAVEKAIKDSDGWSW